MFLAGFSLHFLRISLRRTDRLTSNSVRIWVMKARDDNFSNSVLNLGKNAEVLIMLKQGVCAPAFHARDDFGDAPRYGTVEDEGLGMLWPIFRRDFMGVKQEGNDAAIEITWPTWMSNEVSVLLGYQVAI